MVNNFLKILIIVLLFIILPTKIYAINLGSVVKNNFVEITNTESAKFTMIFWNTGNESYNIRLSAEDAPKDWTILTDPAEFILNKSIGEEYIALPYLNENVKAKVVNIFVKPIENSKPGNYSVVIKAETGLAQNEINDMNIIPERLFKFEINLKGFVESNYDDVEKTEISGKYIDFKNESKVESVSENYNSTDKNFLYFFVVLIIILASIMIYKKYNR